MKILNDFSYIKDNNENLKELGVYSIRIQTIDDEQSIKIMDLLEENFKVYQYKNSTNERYKDYDLYFWSNRKITQRFNYFTLNFNNGSIRENHKIIDKLLMLLIDNFSEETFTVIIQYTLVFNMNKIESVIENCVFDMSKIDIVSLGIIEKNLYNHHSFDLPVRLKDKLNELSIYIKKELLNKKIVFNGMVGKIKLVNNNEYGFFKHRAKTRYYKFELRNINSFLILNN